MGNLGRPEISAERSWIAVSDVEQLNQAAEAWLGVTRSRTAGSWIGSPSTS